MHVTSQDNQLAVLSPELAILPNLYSLKLSNNKLTGNISPLFFDSSYNSLTEISVNNNQINGSNIFL